MEREGIVMQRLSESSELGVENLTSLEFANEVNFTFY